MTSGLPPPRGVPLLGFHQLRKIPAAAFRRGVWSVVQVEQNVDDMLLR